MLSSEGLITRLVIKQSTNSEYPLYLSYNSHDNLLFVPMEQQTSKYATEIHLRPEVQGFIHPPAPSKRLAPKQQRWE